MKGIQLFDNYEDDGQLSLFTTDYDDWEEEQSTAPAPAQKQEVIKGKEAESAGAEVRVKYCASCGKLLFVREETAGFRSECNKCGIKYFQKL